MPWLHKWWEQKMHHKNSLQDFGIRTNEKKRLKKGENKKQKKS